MVARIPRSPALPHPRPLSHNTTETQAELAWRYGEQGVRHWSGGGYLWFADGSAMNRWQVKTLRSVRAIQDSVDARMGWGG